MAGRRGHSRAARLLVAIAAASVAAAVGALLVVGEARVKSIPGLAVAVFGTFLTSMAIIAAFSIEEGSRWPTPWEALDRAHVPAWFSVALASVVTAMLAGALDSSFLSAFSLSLALAAIPLGTWGLWGLISLSSERGRWRLVVDLLAKSILEAGKTERPRALDLGEIDTDDHVPQGFLTAGAPSQPQGTGVSIEMVPGVLREYADRRDLEAIVRLIGEVHAGAAEAFAACPSVGAGAYLNSVDTVLQVQRQMFGDLADRVLSGQLGDATARIALARAGEAVIDAAGRARQADGSAGAVTGEAVEVLVARHLTAFSRLAGAAAREAEVRPGSDGAAALHGVCVELQQAVRWAFDPDPPGMKVPTGHVWRRGLSDPESALTWLWSAAESSTGPIGVGLYAACEILTGRKFFDSYWDGFDVFAEIERRLHGGARDSASAGASLAAIERTGGLPLLSLELAAARLAATPAREHGEPRPGGDPARWDDRHAACNLFLAGGGYKPAGRDPIADLAWLLSDRLRGSLWTTVFDQLAELPDAVVEPPLQPLHRNPEACALAVCLRLAPLQEDVGAADLAALDEFASRLPEPLFERTVELALALTSVAGGRPAAERGQRLRQLVEAARFASEVTSGPLPAQAPAPEGAAAPRERPRDLEPTAFAAAIPRLGGASPELEVDLIQCDLRWLWEWSETRSALDPALLAAALEGRARIRRIVRYDLPAGADRELTRLHYRWIESLSTAVGCFEEGDAASRYEVRLLVVSESGDQAPDDLVSVRDGAPAGAAPAAGFDQLWEQRGGDAVAGRGLIKLGGGGFSPGPLLR